MIATLPALLSLRRRATAAARRVSVVLGALTVVFGVGLMATAGLSDLARRRAPGDPVADGRHRRRPRLRSRAGRSPATSSGSRRTTSRCGRSGASASGLRAHRAARAGASSRATARATCSRAWSPTSTPCRTSTCAGRLPPARGAAGRRGLGRRRRRVRAGRGARPRRRAAHGWRGGARAGRRARASRGRAPGRRSRRAVGRARRAPRAPRRSSSPSAARQAALGRIRAADATLVTLARRDAFATGIGDGLLGSP